MTGFSIPSTAANVTVDTAGSYTYDTNNNMTGTKKLDAYRTISGTNYKISFRAQWTFTFDRKNRLKTHTYPSGLNTRGNIWYDGVGRVWQRWNDDSVTGDWDADLKRFVYDGNALAQEHKFTAGGNGSWTYSYGRCDIDYLRKPDGIRQKANNGVGGWDSHLLFNDGADVASRTPSGSSTTITRTLRTASGERLNDNPRMTPGLTTGSFNNISNLAKPNSYIESYGGGTELGTSSLGFDSLVQSGPVHQLPALSGMLLNSPPAGGGPGGGGSTFGGGIPVGGGGIGVLLPNGMGEGRSAPVDPAMLSSGEVLGPRESHDTWEPEIGGGSEDENGGLTPAPLVVVCVCSTDMDVHVSEPSYGSIRYCYWSTIAMFDCTCDCYCECTQQTVLVTRDASPYPCPHGTKDPSVTEYVCGETRTNIYGCHRKPDAYCPSGGTPSWQCVAACSAVCASRERMMKGGCSRYEGNNVQETKCLCPPEQP